MLLVLVGAGIAWLAEPVPDFAVALAMAANVWVLPYQGLEYLIARDATNGQAFDDRQGTIVGRSLTVVRLVAIAAAVPFREAMGLIAR